MTTSVFVKAEQSFRCQHREHPTHKVMPPLYVEEVHMLEGLDDEELENYMEENPEIVAKFVINVIKNGRSIHYACKNRRQGLRT